MSRTRKAAKPPGWDYWGKRPIGWGSQGSKNKRDGIQRERAILKRELHKEPVEPEYDPREYIPDDVDQTTVRLTHLPYNRSNGK